MSDGPTQKLVEVNVTGGQWNSVDIDLRDYADVVDLTDVIQIIFDTADLAVPLRDFYMDNVAFVGTNEAPVLSASAETGSAVENVVLDGQLDTVNDSDSYHYVLVSDVGSGTLVLNADGSYSFDTGADFEDLAAGATREVSFSYKAVDVLGAESVAKTVTITVTGTNDAPVLTAIAAQTISMNSPAVTIDVLAGATDIDGDSLTISSVSSQQGGTVSVDTGVVSYRPATDFVGPDVVTYEVSDGNGGTITSTVTVDVLPNQAPVFGSDVDTYAFENTDTTSVIRAMATDADGDALTYTLGGDDGDAFEITAAGEVTFKESPDYESGKTDYNFTVTASDGILTDVQNISVDIVNLDELVSIGSAELASGGSFSGEALDDTMDGSASTVSLDLSGGGGNDIMTDGMARRPRRRRR